MRHLKRIVTAVLVSCLLITEASPVLADTAASEITTKSSDKIQIGSANQSYQEYLSGIKNQDMTGKAVEVSGLSYVSGEDVSVVTLPDSLGQALLTEESSKVTWQFDIPVSGMYGFEVTYYPWEGNGSDIRRSVQIDGKTLVAELESVSFNKVFKDEQAIQRVEEGDDIRYSEVEVKKLLTANIIDNDGFYGKALYFYLDAGVHTISFEGIQEPMAVQKLTIFSEKESYVSYEDYLADTKAEDVKGSLEDGILIYEAEEMLEKSDRGIYGTSDFSSSENSPYDYAYSKINVLGGTRWNAVGQWVSYEIEVPKTGYYNIGFRYLQDEARQAVRRLTIDGKVPFEESAKLVFEKDDSWQVSLAGGDDPYKYYLTEGKHVICLEIVASDVKDSLIDAEAVLDELNQMNWALMTILGTDPDANRDYNLDEYMPEVIEQFGTCAEALKKVAEEWKTISDARDSAVAEAEQLIETLEMLHAKPAKIAGKYSSLKDSVSSFATLIENEKKQPLLLDYIFISEADAKLPRAEASLWGKIKTGIMRFLVSFMRDDTSLSNIAEEDKDKETITVWIGNGISGGRDQAMLLNRLIQQSFTPETGINVDLQLVPGGTILTAALTGNGPDVALQLAGSTPVDYAMRSAIMPLSNFEDWEEVAARFAPETLVGYTYLDEVYAVPETMDYSVMFYRKDILNSLGIDVNDLKTWDDLKQVLFTLQSNNMNIGIPSGAGTFYMYLYQNGGRLYNERQTASLLGEKNSLDAFSTFMKFYTDYGLDYSYSLETRFRNGEMPIVISGYSSYNSISIAAPEIAGLWGMTSVPGTEQADGTVDDTVTVGGAGCCIMSAAENPDACWEFLKWWTSAEVQYQYGVELESTLGEGARYTTANIEAISMLPWTAEERNVILDQLDNLVGLPEVPGGYMTGRNVGFAISKVYNKNADARDTLRSYIDAIDEEISLKREEFHLDD